MQTLRLAPGLIVFLLAAIPARTSAQAGDSTVGPPLLWTDYTQNQWARLSATLPTTVHAGLSITAPRVLERSVVVYGRLSLPNLNQTAIGWVRQLGGHVWLSLASSPLGESAAHAIRIDVFRASIGPLPPGTYRVHVVWKQPYREDQLYDEALVVP